MNTPKRTGISLVQTVQTATTHRMVTLGFTPEQAARIIRVRRVLPLVEDRHCPSIDARKLWEKIGKPHGRFNDWAAAYIKPLMHRADLTTEISVLKTPVRGTARIDYRLSRDIAAHLCMLTNTAEGALVRGYFLDMEDLALRLVTHGAVRVWAIVGIDNSVTHLMHKRAGDDAKAGRISRAAVRGTALDRERLLKATVCEVLTGHAPGYWRTTHGRSVRDVLDTEDLHIYSQCYETARAAIETGANSRPALIKYLRKPYGGRVSSAKYRNGTAVGSSA